MKTTNWESEQLQSCTTAASIFQASRQIKYILLPSSSLLLSEIHVCFEGSFSIFPIVSSQKKKKITVVSTNYNGLRKYVSFGVRTANKIVGTTWILRCRFSAYIYIFNGIYTCVSDIVGILFLLHFQWQWNGNDPLCPFASVLGESARMSWQPSLSLGTAIWDAKVWTERKKRDQNEREVEERGKSRHKLAEKL